MNYLFYKQPKEGYGFIYRYTSPSNKSYIGQTRRNLKERSQNNGKGYKNCKIFYSAIQKYGFESFQVEILAECKIEDLDEQEKYYIEKYNTLCPNGYNYYLSGAGPRKGKTNKKMVDVYDLQCNYLTSFSSISEAARAYGVQWQSISQCVRKEIEYYIDKIYVYYGEIPKKPSIVKTHGRVTAQYDLEGNFLKQYKSANEAARSIGKGSNAGRNIRAVCEGKRNKAFGYIWKFLD